MIFFGGFLGLIALAVWIFCIIDVITTPAEQVRLLPKLAWVAIVVLLVELGAIAWLLAGRPWNARAMTPGAPRPGAAGGGLGVSGTSPQRRRPARPTNPDDDDEFLASLTKQQRDRDRRDDDPGQPA